MLLVTSAIGGGGMIGMKLLMLLPSSSLPPELNQGRWAHSEMICKKKLNVN
jgi:hypothetical protein